MPEENIHVHTFTDTVILPSCKERGYTLHRCDCGYSHKDNFTPLGQHAYEDLEVTAASCTQAGSRKRRCRVCGEEHSAAFPPLGHDWEPWNVLTFATCTESGQQVRACRRCQETELQTIPPKGHALQRSKNEKGQTVHFCKNCGEEISVPTLRDKVKGVWAKCKKPVSLSFAAVLAVIVLIFTAVNFLIPQFHYSMGKQQLEKRNYEKAISHFMKCRDYRDSDEYLSGFVIFSDMEKTETDSNGETSEETERLIYTYRSYRYFWPGGYAFTQYDAHENPTVYVLLDNTGKVENWYTYENTYNEQGALINVRIFETSSVKDHVLIEEIKYNDRGEQTELIYYMRGEISQRSYFDYDYTYDEKGRVRSAICRENGEFWEENRYTYYGNGKIKEKTVHGKDGSINLVEKYYRNGEVEYRAYYYSDGNVHREEEYYRSGELKYRATYYENGQIETEAKYYRNGAIKQFSYNEDGYIRRKFIEKGNGESTEIYYDADGKKIKENKFDDHYQLVYQLIIADGKKHTGRTTYSYDRYGRAAKQVVSTRKTGDGISTKYKKESVFRYTDLEIRYMPHYIAEHPSGK